MWVVGGHASQPVCQSIRQQQQCWIGAGHKNIALPTADDLRRAGEMRHEGELACSCLSRCQVPCVPVCVGIGVGEFWPIVWIPGAPWLHFVACCAGWAPALR